MIEDQEITDYINQAFTEEVILRYENQLLHVLKTRYEEYPTPENDKEWLDYTNFFCQRRCQRNNKG
jgi:hypothetical protein